MAYHHDEGKEQTHAKAEATQPAVIPLLSSAQRSVDIHTYPEKIGKKSDFYLT
jgi:hypothetical protein